MIYLDTGCFLKLYCSEPESSRVISLVQGKQIAYSPLLALEFENALRLKVFRNEVSTSQVAAAKALVAGDLQQGSLQLLAPDWGEVFREGITIAERFSSIIGCRSLDILHCAIARAARAKEFVSTDRRQMTLAVAIGLNVVTI